MGSVLELVDLALDAADEAVEARAAHQAVVDGVLDDGEDAERRQELKELGHFSLARLVTVRSGIGVEAGDAVFAFGGLLAELRG